MCLAQDIVSPSVSMLDNDIGASLCTYELEEQPEDVRRQFTSVCMCKVSRSSRCGSCPVPSRYDLSAP